MKNKKSPARAKAWDSESFCSYRCLLTVRIHVVIVLLVITRGYVVHPFLVIEIPFYSLLDTLLKLERWSTVLITTLKISMARAWPTTYCISRGIMQGINSKPFMIHLKNMKEIELSLN